MKRRSSNIEDGLIQGYINHFKIPDDEIYPTFPLLCPRYRLWLREVPVPESMSVEILPSNPDLPPLPATPGPTVTEPAAEPAAVSDDALVVPEKISHIPYTPYIISTGFYVPHVSNADYNTCLNEWKDFADYCSTCLYNSDFAWMVYVHKNESLIKAITEFEQESMMSLCRKLVEYQMIAKYIKHVDTKEYEKTVVKAIAEEMEVECTTDESKLKKEMTLYQLNRVLQTMDNLYLMYERKLNKLQISANIIRSYPTVLKSLKINF